MNIEELLEGISSVVFHATTINSGLKILQSDALTSKSGQVSFTRSLAGEYHSYNKIVGIIFEVDGRALSARYKAKPVAGYHHDYVDEADYDPDYKSETDQMEDRLLTPEIKGFKRYVRSAIIYVPAEYLKSSREDELGENYLENLRNVFKLIEVLRAEGINYRSVTSHAGLFDRKRDETSKLMPLYQDMLRAAGELDDGDVEEEEEESPYSVSVEVGDDPDATVYALMDDARTLKVFTYGEVKSQSGMRNDEDYSALEAYLHKIKLVPANMPIAFFET